MISEQELLTLLMNEHKANVGRAVSIDEFREDVMRLIYVGRLLKKFKSSGKINCRLLINHVVILHNIFNTQTAGLLFLLTDQEYHGSLYALLQYFNKIPAANVVTCFDDTIDISDVVADNSIIIEIEKCLEDA